MVGLSSRKYRTQLRGDQNLDFLFGCIGEKIKVITTIYFDNVYVPTPDYPIFYNPPAAFYNRLYNADIVAFGNSAFLNEAQVNDLFTAVGSIGGIPYVLNFTMLEKIASGAMRTDTIFGVGVESSPDSFVANVTPLKSLIYQFGLGIGGFKSKTDDSTQKFLVTSNDKLSDITVTLDNIGNKDWQFDSVYSEGQGAGPYITQQILTIVHETIVSPLFLASEYADLQKGIAPTYFKPDNKIKYSSQIDFNKNAFIVNPASTLYPDDVGQFGWFNTRFDGSKSVYSINSLQFKRVDLSVANQLEYSPIEVKFIINSETNNFDVTNTAMVFGFNFLPSDETFYQETGRTIEENFCFDSKFFNPNNISVNGDKFGTPKQVIREVKGNILSSSTCEVTVIIDIGAGNYPILKQSDIAQYQIWCIVERVDLTPSLSDKTNLLIDVNYIYVQKTKIDLLDNDTLFIEHPYDSLQYAQETLTMFPVDDVVANNLITLDYTGLENDNILLKGVTPSIVLTHPIESDIILDSYFISLLNYPLVGTLPSVQYVKFQSNRPYRIEDGIRKTITMFRNYALDSGNTKAWLLSFPFMNRWEYWIQVLNFIDIPSDLFDNTVPFGGANHFWNRLVNTSDWKLMYRTTFDIIQNGEDFEQVFEKELTSTNFNSNTDWSDCEITSHDIPTGTQIIKGVKEYVYAKKNTLIRAEFTKSTGLVPDVDGVYAVIWCEGFEGGGISEIRNIDSGRDVIPTSCFAGINGTKRVSITKVGNTFTCEAILDYNKLPSLQKNTVYARIYEIQSGDPLDGRITNDDILRMTLDGQIRLVN